MNLEANAILDGFRAAIESFATQEEEEFLAWLDSHEDLDAAPAQRLFAHALASAPERYASRALKFLLADKRRFELGNLEDTSATSKRPPVTSRAASIWGTGGAHLACPPDFEVASQTSR